MNWSLFIVQLESIFVILKYRVWYKTIGKKLCFIILVIESKKIAYTFFPALDVTFIMFIRQLHHSNGSELKKFISL